MTTVHPLPATRTPDGVRVDGSRVVVTDLETDDPGLADLLAAHPAEQWPDLVRRALAVGARGLLTMGIGIDVSAIDGRVRETLAAVTAEAEQQVDTLLEAGRRAFTEHLDPERRSSILGRALSDFGTWRDTLLAGIDPERSDSRAAAFLDRLGDLLGPGGALEERLSGALDPDADGSVFSRIDATIDDRFRELRDLIVREEGRRHGRTEEAERGTAQGLDFEDAVEDRLRNLAGGLAGCTVERTTRTPGALGPNATVGDFVVTTADGDRIAVEAKNQAQLSLTGKDGILAELDRVLANREAAVAICISGRDAFPGEVGTFGVYGDRILVVDDGDGTMTAVALRWALTSLARRRNDPGAAIDLSALGEHLDRIRMLADRFKTTRRSLTDIGKSVESVRDTLAAMRTDLLDLVDEVQRTVTTPSG
jgi:hypothetical protein